MYFWVSVINISNKENLCVHEKYICEPFFCCLNLNVDLHKLRYNCVHKETSGTEKNLFNEIIPRYCFEGISGTLWDIFYELFPHGLKLASVFWRIAGRDAIISRSLSPEKVIIYFPPICRRVLQALLRDTVHIKHGYHMSKANVIKHVHMAPRGPSSASSTTRKAELESSVQLIWNHSGPTRPRPEGGNEYSYRFRPRS